jgi:hypothetical protein
VEVVSGQRDLLRSKDLYVGGNVLVSHVFSKQGKGLSGSCCATPSGGIGAFGGIITKGFGFTALNAILMQIPTGVLGICILLSSIWLTNKYKLRFPVIA